MIIEINEEQLYKHWNKDTIEKISSEKNMSFLETVIYLWLYNNVSISAKDRDIDFGRKMYEKFANRTKEQKIERLKRNLRDYKKLLRNEIIKKYDELISYIEMRIEQLEQELKELEDDNKREN